MGLFGFVTRAFIDVFGITHPTARQERTATWYIGSLLGLILLGVALVFSVLYVYGHR